MDAWKPATLVFFFCFPGIRVEEGTTFAWTFFELEVLSSAKHGTCTIQYLLLIETPNPIKFTD